MDSIFYITECGHLSHPLNLKIRKERELVLSDLNSSGKIGKKEKLSKKMVFLDSLLFFSHFLVALCIITDVYSYFCQTRRYC